MSKKSEIKKMIADIEKEIEALEKKRGRSQSALIQSLLLEETPDPQEKEYFRVFTTLIDTQRKNLRTLNEELKKL